MKARKVKKLDPQGPLVENAARIVTTRLGELRDLATDALVPGATVAQHDMRIAAKRLRYVLEVTQGCFGEEASKARREAKELQTVLGEIHDCDVMLPRAINQIELLQAEDVRAILLRDGEADDLDPGLARGAPNRTAYRGLELLVVHLKARRALLFERFRQLWESQAGKGTWTSLERSLGDA